MNKLLVSIIAMASIIAACDTKQEKKENKISKEEIMSESNRINVFFDKVFDEYVDRSPMYQSYMGIKKDYDKWDDISDAHEIQEIEILNAKLDTLKKNFDIKKLDEQSKLSYRIFEYNVKQKKEAFEYRFHSYPVNQMFGLHSEIPSFLINIHQITSLADADAYISRLNKIPVLIDQLITNLKIREEKKIIAPKFVFPMVLDDCRNILKGAPFEKTCTSTLLEDFSSKIKTVDSIKADDKKKLVLQVNEALLKSVKPSYEKLITYLSQLEKKATTDDGVWKFPDGNNFYKTALRHTTTTNLSPEEIYQIGLSEVASIHTEMRKVMKEVNFKTDSLQEFFEFIRKDPQFYYANTSEGKAAYLKKTNEIIDTMRASLDKLFITKPKASLTVKAVEPFREKSAGSAFYQEPAPDGSRPGIYYVNLHDMSSVPKYEMEALAYHEAIPGHHMQLSIAQELKNVPKFRRFGNYTAYVEGWGLYTELIAKEMGFYADPYSNFGRLSMELWRACRLVVDVGIHEKKWTREQAIDYLRKNTSNSETECRKSIERYIVMPSQATAYKIGMLKILTLREKAKKELGAKFDIREFHDVVLKFGAVPLDILEENVNDWVKAKK